MTECSAEKEASEPKDGRGDGRFVPTIGLNAQDILQLVDMKITDLNGHVFVIGMGGGCDILFAHAIAKLLEAEIPQEKIHVANCIGNRDLTGHVNVKEHIFSLPRHNVIPSSSGHGTTQTEQSLPERTDGGPFVILTASDEEDDVAELQRRNATLIQEIDEIMGSEKGIIIGVDAGGDSLSGGIDHSGDIGTGRDRQMLAVLSRCQSNFIHLVIGPCCDGETLADDMTKTVGSAIEKGVARAIASLHPIQDHLRSVWHDNLGTRRTPAIIMKALEFSESVGESAHVVVPRGVRPRVPIYFLTHGLFLIWQQPIQPSEML